jgi:serine/threonine protein kinase
MRAAFSPPTEVAEYRIVRLLGRGAMGQVYLAHDTLLDRPVAIKFIAAEPSSAIRERFLVEARAIARLTHPNVVSVYRVGEHAGRPYLVSEFVRGQSLAELAKPVSVEQALKIGLGLSAGLRAAHLSGVLHRDVKPANAILADGGEAKLLDFGLAKLLPSQDSVSPVSGDESTLAPELAAKHSTEPDSPTVDVTLSAPAAVEKTALPTNPASAAVADPPLAPLSLTKTGALIGTPRYMAPEIFAGEAATARSDVYSLGALLFELLVGKPPFLEPDLARLSVAVRLHSAPPLRPLLPDGVLADRLAEVVDRCLRRDPQARYTDGAELYFALAALGPQAGAGASSDSRRKVLFLGIAALLAVGLSLWTLISVDSRPVAPAGPSDAASAIEAAQVDAAGPVDLTERRDLLPELDLSTPPFDAALPVRRSPAAVIKRAPATKAVKPAPPDVVEIPIER